MSRKYTASAVDGWEDTIRYQSKASCRTLQEFGMDAANGAMGLASDGVLYVARELVFALSGADLEYYGMEDTSRTEERRRSKSKSKRARKKKEKKNRPADVSLYSSGKVEGRDEESERAYSVVDLITKFNNEPPKSMLRNNPNTTISPTTPSVPPAASSNKSQDIFRPRSNKEEASPEEAERFAYLTAQQQPNARSVPGSAVPDVAFSPLASFKELHQANKKAMFDDSSSNAVRRQPENVERQEDKAKDHETVKSTATDIVDIRGEIEDIQRIIARLGKERVEQRKQDESSPTKSTEIAPKKDPKRVEEIRALISRLERLSIRHEELKAKQIANSTCVTRDPAPAVSATAVTSQ